jgi:hypothetical protein
VAQLTAAACGFGGQFGCEAGAAEEQEHRLRTGSNVALCAQRSDRFAQLAQVAVPDDLAGLDLSDGDQEK